MIVGLLFVLCVGAILAGRRVPTLGTVSMIAKSVLVFVATWMIWMTLLMLNVVKVDPLLSRLGLYRLEEPWAALLFFTPPVAAAAAYLVFAARRRHEAHR